MQLSSIAKPTARLAFRRARISPIGLRENKLPKLFQ